MAEDILQAQSPCADLLPVTIGPWSLREEAPGAITALLPYAGQQEALSRALGDAHGMAWPAPGRATGKAAARCVWTGRQQAMLIGPAPDAGLARHAALTDQSDAWAVVTLSGPGSKDVLARLVPVDLRAARFRRGHSARTLLGHMSASVTRTGAETFQIMVFRSMAATLVHELKSAMSGLAARSGRDSPAPPP